VLPVHGDIRKNKCFANCQGNPTYVDVTQLEWDPDSGPPQCPHCGAYVRPDVVWYEETLPPALIDRALRLTRTCDVMLVIGTSGVTYPIAQLPIEAYRRGAVVIEVNPERTPISAAAKHILRGPSGQMLPLVVAAIKTQIAAENAPESPDA
jgi:NAD-dependent deacetylase